MVYALDGGGPKDSENALNSFLTKPGKDVFWQIGADMISLLLYLLLIVQKSSIKLDYS